MYGTAEDKAGIRPGFARILLVPLRSGSDLRKRNSEVFNSCRFYPVKPAARALAGVPLLWPGTDVLLDPGDDHGGIVSPGTVVHDDAHRANVPRRRNGCAWARRTLNSRQSAETIPTATPRCPPVLSPLLRCPCSPGPEPVTPSSSTGSTSPSESGSTTSAFRSGSSALAGPQHAFAPELGGDDPGPGGQVMAGQEAAKLAHSLAFLERCASRTITATCVPSIDPPSLSVTAVRVLLFVSRTKAEARR
jgi:hypothetical protein